MEDGSISATDTLVDFWVQSGTSLLSGYAVYSRIESSNLSLSAL